MKSFLNSFIFRPNKNFYRTLLLLFVIAIPSAIAIGFVQGDHSEREIIYQRYPETQNDIFAEMSLLIKTPVIDRESHISVQVTDLKIYGNTGTDYTIGTARFWAGVPDDEIPGTYYFTQLIPEAWSTMVVETRYTSPFILMNIKQDTLDHQLLFSTNYGKGTFDVSKYPFIQGHLDLVFQLSVHDYEKNEDIFVDPIIYVRVDNPSSWVVSSRLDTLEISGYFPDGEIEYDGYRLNRDLTTGNKLSMNIHMPLYLRLFVSIFVVGLLFMVGLLAEIKSAEGFIEAAAAMLFGLFGARQLILPANLEGQTFLDMFFLLCFALIAIIAVYKSFPYLVRDAKKYMDFSKSAALIGSKTKVLHRQGCKVLLGTDSKSYRSFDNEEDALQAGYRRCKRCFKD